MHKLTVKKVAVAVVAAAAVAIGGQTAFAQDTRPVTQAAVEARYSELPNFHHVNEHLYRGAQPGEGGMKRLADLGIKTVVNLRGEEGLSRREEADAKAAGLRYFNIPMGGLSRPTEQQMKRAMAIIDAPENWPVFIHCQHGSDRTGTVVACYHISHDGWTVDRSIAEAKRYGMSWLEFGMRGYISDYYSAADHRKRDENLSVASGQPSKGQGPVASQP